MTIQRNDFISTYTCISKTSVPKKIGRLFGGFKPNTHPETMVYWTYWPVLDKLIK